jgi:hypothetical protein
VSFKSEAHVPVFQRVFCLNILIFLYIFGGLDWVGHSFDYVAHFVFLRDVWIRIQRSAVANKRAPNLATHLPHLATHLPNLASYLPNFAIHLPLSKHGADPYQ